MLTLFIAWEVINRTCNHFLNRNQLKTTTDLLIGHTTVKEHLWNMGKFNGDLPGYAVRKRNRIEPILCMSCVSEQKAIHIRFPYTEKLHNTHLIDRENNNHRLGVKM